MAQFTHHLISRMCQGVESCSQSVHYTPPPMAQTCVHCGLAMLGQRVRAVVARVTIEPLALLSCILFTLSTITTEELYLRHTTRITITIIAVTVSMHYGLTGGWVQKFKASYLGYLLQCALTDYARGKA